MPDLTSKHSGSTPHGLRSGAAFGSLRESSGITRKQSSPNTLLWPSLEKRDVPIHQYRAAGDTCPCQFAPWMVACPSTVLSKEVTLKKAITACVKGSCSQVFPLGLGRRPGPASQALPPGVWLSPSPAAAAALYGPLTETALRPLCSPHDPHGDETFKPT